LVVLEILVPAVTKLSKDDSHRMIAPVNPLKVNRVEFVPAQTEALPVIDPPTEAGDTVIVALALLASAHAPLVTTAL
jgi:hypothetical protein